MKAKEYADWFKINIEKCGTGLDENNIAQVKKCLGEFYQMFIKDYQGIKEARHISTGPGQAAILKELDMKCGAVSRLLSKANSIPIKPSFFKEIFLHNNPQFEKHFY